eukprot:gene7090-5024_t
MKKTIRGWFNSLLQRLRVTNLRYYYNNNILNMVLNKLGHSICVCDLQIIIESIFFVVPIAYLPLICVVVPTPLVTSEDLSQNKLKKPRYQDMSSFWDYESRKYRTYLVLCNAPLQLLTTMGQSSIVSCLHLSEIYWQNSFRWSDHHLFRPHQHFTYDPSAWSRKAQEQAKSSLPILERIEKNRSLIQDKYCCLESGTREEDVKPFTCGTQHLVALQDTVHLVASLEEKLNYPRYTKYLTVRKKQLLTADLQSQLVRLYAKLQESAADEEKALSLPVTAPLWGILLEHVELLIPRIAQNAIEYESMMSLINGAETECSTGVIEDYSKFFCQASFSSFSVETLIELTNVLVHPFVLHCVSLYNKNDLMLNLLRCTNPVVEAVIAAMHERILDSQERRAEALKKGGNRGELLTPVLLQTWSRTLRRLAEEDISGCGSSTEKFEHKEVLIKRILQLSALVRRCAGDVSLLLRASLPGLPSTGKDAPLLHLQSLAKNRSIPRCAHNMEKGFKGEALDRSVPPGGIVKPLTTPRDASCLLQSCIHLWYMWEKARRASPQSFTEPKVSQTEVQICDTLDSVLATLSCTPNYDLSVRDTAGLCCALLEEERYLAGTELPGEPSHRLYRVLLLASRLEVDFFLSEDELCRLSFALAKIPMYAVDPSTATRTPLISECQRLRGLTLHRAFSVLQAANIESYVSKNSKCAGTPWEVQLNDAEVSIPASLWKEACKLRGLWPTSGQAIQLNSVTASLDPQIGAALIALRSREKGGTMDSCTACCIANCVAVVLGDPCWPSDAYRCSDKWETVVATAPSNACDECTSIHSSTSNTFLIKIERLLIGYLQLKKNGKLYVFYISAHQGSLSSVPSSSPFPAFPLTMLPSNYREPAYHDQQGFHPTLQREENGHHHHHRINLSDPACALNVGVTRAKDGSVYVGEHVGTERHGSGTVLYEDGMCLTGNFNMGRCERGLQFQKDSCKMYSNGRMVGEYRVRDVDPELILCASSRMASHLQDLVRVCAPDAEGIFTGGDDGKDPETSPHVEPQSHTNAWHDEFPKSDDVSISTSITDENSRGGCRRRRNDLREELAHTASPEAVFSCAGPVATEFFSFFRFVRRFFAFLFPFLSLPGICCSPCPVDSLDIEREFIVSGASLQRSFDSPGLSLYVSALALCCDIAAIAVLMCDHPYFGTLDEGRISLCEIFFPSMVWLLNAFVCASYFGFRRSPHGLERMNRELTAELTALAANVVDSKSDICIYSWDETGRDKVKNKRYRIKWALLSLLIAYNMAVQVIFVRKLYGFKGIAETKGGSCYTVLSGVSIGLFAFVISYYMLKGLDMQREVRSKLVVLTKIAYIERKSLLAPGTYTKDHFCCDAPLDISDLKNGFSGWFTTRSLVLCASPGANHQSRGASMSILVFIVFYVATIEIAVNIYHSLHIERKDYSHFMVHSYSVLLAWGPICIQYLNVCSSIRAELKRHLYIMDVTSLYHRLHNRDVEASSIINACRAMAAEHDIRPTLLNIPLHPFIVWVITVWIIFGMVLSVTSFVLSKPLTLSLKLLNFLLDLCMEIYMSVCNTILCYLLCVMNNDLFRA